MSFQIVRDNIVHMHTDAIVNAANEQLLPGGGVCGAIFEAAGHESLQAACRIIGHCPTGQTVITPGFRLPARYVIHAVGPVWRGGGHGEEARLRACYRNALALVTEYRLQSVAFPLISSGIYSYPKDRALQVAVSEISAFVLQNEADVFLVIYDAQSFRLSEKLFSDISAFIDDTCVDQREEPANPDFQPGVLTGECAARMSRDLLNDRDGTPFAPRSLEDALRRAGKPFTPTLLSLIDNSGKTDVEVYKRANIDRKLFSKLRSDRLYRPSKSTALALAIALELSLGETQSLLATAGYTLSNAQKADVIVKFFISNGNYDIYEINQALFAFGQPLLGL